MAVTFIMAFQLHGKFDESLYTRRLLRSLLSKAGLESFDTVLEFAISNKLLSTFLSSGLLDAEDCSTEADRQEAARRAAAMTLSPIGLIRNLGIALSARLLVEGAPTIPNLVYDEVAAVSVDGQALGTTGYSKCEYRARPS